jgi:hypothetical protein
LQHSLLAAALAFLLTGCMSMPSITGHDAAPSGEIHFGTAVLHPTTCSSGQWQMFLGADFPDASGTTTRLILDPNGVATLRFFRADKPLEPGVSFTRSACEKFEVSLQRSGWEINDVYDLRVSLNFECRSASGDIASGQVTADHCH